MLLKRQETVKFDPSNKTHRAAVRAFLRRRAWIDSPIRFSHDPAYGSVAEQVQARLLQWYVDQEENRGKKVSPVQSTKVGDKELAFAMMGIASEFKQ